MIAHVISLLAAEDPTQTHSWILPETAEIIYGGLATVIVVSALAKFAGPMIKKSFSARTEKIQKELDDAAAAKVTAESDAQNIRKALGDVAGERARILAEADTQLDIAGNRRNHLRRIGNCHCCECVGKIRWTND